MNLLPLLLSIVLTVSGAQVDRCPAELHLRPEAAPTVTDVEALVGFSHYTHAFFTERFAEPADGTYHLVATCATVADTTYLALMTVRHTGERLFTVIYALAADGQPGSFVILSLQNPGLLPGSLKLLPFADRNADGRPDFGISGEAAGCDGSACVEAYHYERDSRGGWVAFTVEP